MIDRDDPIGEYTGFSSRPDGVRERRIDIVSDKSGRGWTVLVFAKTGGGNAAFLSHEADRAVDREDDVTNLFEGATSNSALLEEIDQRHERWWEPHRQRIYKEEMAEGLVRLDYSNVMDMLENVKTGESLYFDRGRDDGKGPSTRLEFIRPDFFDDTTPDIRFHYLMDGKILSTMAGYNNDLTLEFGEAAGGLVDMSHFSSTVERLHDGWVGSCETEGARWAAETLNKGHEPAGMVI